MTRKYTEAEREATFWSTVGRTDGCWEWQGRFNGVWHGRFRYPSGQYAHRFSWELHYGGIPTGLQVNHHCDNPRCVRPAHLYLGTQADNVWDRDVRGRRNVRGERNPAAVLSRADIDIIRAEPHYHGVCVDLGRRFCVSRSLIGKIRAGIRWPESSAIE